MTPCKLNIVASQGSSWVWRAEVDIDPALLRPLSDAEFKMLKEALPRLLASIIERRQEEPEPAGKRKK